jgi:flagellar hook assembly protein FlgD/DNA/RNA endonuclease YhcR with UshA esterase domain
MMRNLLTSCFIVMVAMLLVSSNAQADVFAMNIRVTNEGSTLPFDGRFTDGTGAAVRFTLSDRADSVVVNIRLSATLVRTISLPNFNIGDTLVVWDGKNDAGAFVSTGNYNFSVTTYNNGYGTYTEISYPDAAGLSQRGMTTVNNPALKNFGFIFDTDNSATTAVGIGRYTADGKPWGNAKGTGTLTSTGIALGASEARWGAQADKDGYVYVASRTNKQILRYHTDTLNVVIADSAFGVYYPFGIGIREETVGKTIAVVTNNNSGTATLTGDSRILTFRLNSPSATNLPTCAKDTLLKGNGQVMFWDIVFGRDSVFYATFMYPADAGRSGIAKFDVTGKTLPLTMADTVWTARVDSGRVSTCSMYFGAASDGSNDRLYFVNARIASGNPPSGQGIHVVTDLNTLTPIRTLAFADKQNNASITRSDISVDAVGNLVYFENSNEEIAVIAPPTGPNNYTTNGLKNIIVFNSVSIAAARVDANADLQPDSVGRVMTVSGVVNALNVQGASGFSYTIQDGTGGIMIYKSGAPPFVLNIGDRIVVTGPVAYYRGSTELMPANLTTDLTVLDSNNPLTPVTLTLPQYLANAEAYESQLIKITGIAKKSTSPAWPILGADANMIFWDGWDTTTVRIDKDLNVDGSTEPTYPVTVAGVATQYTSSSTIHNNGYQITPNNPIDFTGGIAVAPNPHFALTTPANNSIVRLDSLSQQVVFSWKKAIDLNGDNLIYQWAPIGFTAVITTTAGADSFLVRTGTQMLTYLGSLDTLNLRWTVKTKDPANPIVSNFDTVTVKIIRGTITGVGQFDQMPNDFALSQNYPNPFNPTTTIRFALPVEARITLRIYDLLGREIATLADGVREAGTFEAQWDGHGVASGMYIYRFEAQGADGNRLFAQTRRMALLK